MKGLLIKEYCMMKGQIKSWIALYVFFLVYSIMLGDNAMIYMIIAMVGVMGGMATFTYDMLYQWDSYMLSMPVDRKMVVYSKYLFMLILDAATVICSIVMLFLTQILKGGMSGVLLELPTLAGILGVTILMQLVIVPLIYKIGVEKARYVFMAMFMLPTILILGFHKVLDGIVTRGFLTMLLYAFPFLLAAFAVFSVWVSIKIYQSKEF